MILKTYIMIIVSSKFQVWSSCQSSSIVWAQNCCSELSRPKPQVLTKNWPINSCPLVFVPMFVQLEKLCSLFSWSKLFFRCWILFISNLNFFMVILSFHGQLWFSAGLAANLWVFNMYKLCNIYGDWSTSCIRWFFWYFREFISVVSLLGLITNQRNAISAAIGLTVYSLQSCLFSLQWRSTQRRADRTTSSATLRQR
jgi:hypothetical protein